MRLELSITYGTINASNRQDVFLAAKLRGGSWFKPTTYFFSSDAGAITRNGVRTGWIDTTELQPGKYCVKGFASQGASPDMQAESTAYFEVR